MWGGGVLGEWWYEVFWNGVLLCGVVNKFVMLKIGDNWGLNLVFCGNVCVLDVL